MVDVVDHATVDTGGTRTVSSTGLFSVDGHGTLSKNDKRRLGSVDYVSSSLTSEADSARPRCLPASELHSSPPPPPS